MAKAAKPSQPLEARKQVLRPISSKAKGLITRIPPHLLSPDEFESFKNFYLIPKDPRGENLLIGSRPGLLKVTTATTNDKGIECGAYIQIGGTFYYLLVDTDHKLYSCTGSEPSLNPGSAKTLPSGDNALEGEAQIVPFNDQAIILDGSYIKVWDGSNLTLAYDNGTGSRARMVHQSCETLADANSVNLDNSNTRAGEQITTDSWTSGYTIPLTKVKFWLSKTGSPTGTISCKIYNSDGSSELATATTTFNIATEVTENEKLYTFEFSLSATQDLSPSTSYIIAVVYSSGDGSNYLTVHGYSKASGGKQYYHDGSWHNVSTAGMAIDVYPSLPPKGSFGAVKSGRLFVAGDPDNEGYVWFGNENSVLDWSTSDGGGYVSAIDNSANSFPVGALVTHFKELIVIGKSEQPYISILTGDSPSEYSLPPTQQHVAGNQKSVIPLPNDIIVTSEAGTTGLKGVEAKGDLRTYPASRQIQDIVRDNWDTDAFAGYISKDGLYVLKLSGLSDLYVCHTALPDTPWAKWTLANSVTPTCFFMGQNTLYMGGSDGNLYRFDYDEYQDQDGQGDKNSLTFEVKTGVLESSFGEALVRHYYANVSREVSSYKIKFYVSGGGVKRSIDVVPAQRVQQNRVNVVGDSIQIELDSFSITAPFEIHGVALEVIKLKRRLTETTYGSPLKDSSGELLFDSDGAQVFVDYE